MRLRNWLLLLLTATLLGTVVLPETLPPALRPDLFAMLAVFLMLRARRDQMLQFCWFTGFARDLASGGPLGAMALLYLLAAALLVHRQRLLNPRHPLPQALLAFCVAFFTEAVLLAPAALHAERALVTDALATLFIASLVTAALTPIATLVLDQFKQWLGLERWFVFGAR